MKKNFNTQLIHTGLFTCAIVLTVLFFVSPVSCRLTEEGIEIVPADTTAPAVENFSVTGSKNLLISCSEKIILDKINIIELNDDEEPEDFPAPDDENEVFAVADEITYSEDGKSAEVEISEEMLVGKAYAFSGVVYDITGNSLEFSQKIIGYNANPAELAFNEIRTTYNKSKQAVEYVEFYVLREGNTFGLEFVSAANGEGKKYSFPAMEVKKGEFITLHGRILEEMEEGAVSEYGEDLTLSTANESCETARDLWKEGNEKIASNNDVLVLRNFMKNELKDVVLLSQSEKKSWSKKLMTELAEEAYSRGLWKGGSSTQNAICTDSMSSSLYRSISKQNKNMPSSASDWVVTDKITVKKVTTSGATPGYENSTNVCTAK